jgi:hypothetical protein
MRNFVLIVLLFSGVEIYSQEATVVISGLSGPLSSVQVGNDLYFTQSDFQNFTNGKLSRIDITETTPNVIDIFTGFTDLPGAIILNDDELIFAEQSTIYRTDISESTPQLEIIFQLPQNETFAIEGLDRVGNDLYFVESWNGVIAKIDLTESNPQVDTILIGLAVPTSIVIEGNNAYFTETSANTVSRFNINDVNPLPEIIGTNFIEPYSLALSGNNLYVSEFAGNKISYIDLTQNTPIMPLDFVLGLSSPLGLNLEGNTLYFSEPLNGTISQIGLSVVSADDVLINNRLNIFPNPASSFIEIQGMTENEHYIIINVLGQLVKSGRVKNNEQINISNLDNGFYKILIDNQIPYSFIKN